MAQRWLARTFSTAKAAPLSQRHAALRQRLKSEGFKSPAAFAVTPSSSNLSDGMGRSHVLQNKVAELKPIVTNQASGDVPLLEDRFGRFHDYVRLSVTERCNFRCTYCMPEEGVDLTPNAEMLTLEEIAEIGSFFAKSGARKFRITGGEPLVRRGVVGLVRKLAGFPGVKSVGMTTNGLLLGRHLDALALSGLASVNISLDTLHPERFEAMTRRKGFTKVRAAVDAAASWDRRNLLADPLRFSKALEELAAPHNNIGSNGVKDKTEAKIGAKVSGAAGNESHTIAGSSIKNDSTANCSAESVNAEDDNVDWSSGSNKLHVKVNCVVMRGENEHELASFVELTKHQALDVRFIEWMPFDQNQWQQQRFVGYREMLSLIVEQGGPPMERLNAAEEEANSDTTKWFRVPGYLGRVGFITSMSEHFCGTCNRVRVTADGKLKACLFGAHEVDLREPLRRGRSMSSGGIGDGDNSGSDVNSGRDDSGGNEMTMAVQEALAAKHPSLGGHADMLALHAADNTNRSMIRIGG